MIDLSELDLDYTSIGDELKDLTLRAAKVAGTEISLVNLIDTYTQWSVAKQGIEFDHLSREDSVCQYTIAQGSDLEILDLANGERFRETFYVKGDPRLRYYYGVPLKTPAGNSIGASCVFDKEAKQLTGEKVELLRIIAHEVVTRLLTIKAMDSLHKRVRELSELRKRVAHDIRGPLGGIIGLTEIINDQGNTNQLAEILEFVNMIHSSSRSLLELADEILSTEGEPGSESAGYPANELNQLQLKEKLEKLYAPQAKSKGVAFSVFIEPASASVPFPKNKLLQILGNLISNSIKFTPSGGEVRVEMGIEDGESRTLCLRVVDTGGGISLDRLATLRSVPSISTPGTAGEKGFGFGLELVRHHVQSLKGRLKIASEEGKGSTFDVYLPIS